MNRRLSFAILFVFLLAGCGGNSDGQRQLPVGDGAYTGQALLGPVVGALAQVYDYRNLSGEPLCSVETSDDDNLETAGSIRIPRTCVEEGGLYVVRVSGGQDIDTDDDGVIDAVPTDVNGVFHALISYGQVVAGNWKVSALTESIFQSLRLLIAQEASVDQVLQEMERLAGMTIREDADGDGRVSSSDILQWNPRTQSHLVIDDIDTLRELIDSIHEGEPETPDVTEPVSRQVDRIDTFGDALRVVRADDRVLVGTRNLLLVVGLEDPSGARIIGGFPSGHSIGQLAASGDQVFLSAYANGLHILDVSDPAQPVLEQTLALYASGLHLRGEELLVTGMDDNYATVLQVVDLGGEEEAVTGSTVVGYEGGELAVSGDRGYLVTNMNESVFVYDLSDATQPVKLGTYRSGDSSSYFSSHIGAKGDVFLAGLYSYADGERTYELLVVDASYPDAPVELGRLSVPTYLRDVLIVANSAFVCLGDAGVLVVDISDPREPTALATLEVPGGAGEIAVADGRAYVAAGSGGLVVLEVADLIVPEVEAPALYTGQAVLGPVVGGSVTVHRAEDAGGAALCSMTSLDGAQLSQAGRIEVPAECVSESGLYLISVQGGEDVDVADDGVRDATPTPVSGTLHALLTQSQIQANGWKVSALTEASYQRVSHLLGAGYVESQVLQTLDQDAELYLGADLNGDAHIDHRDLGVWDPVADAAVFIGDAAQLALLTAALHDGTATETAALALTPPLEGRLLLAEAARGVAVSDHRVYVRHWHGWSVVDASDSARMQVSGVYALENTTRDLLVSGDRVYLSASGDGLHILDVSDPAQPELEQTLALYASGLHLRGEELLVTGMDDNYATVLQVVDLGGEEAAVTGSTVVGYEGGELAVSGDRGYLVTNMNESVFVYDLSDATQPVKLGTYRSGDSSSYFSSHIGAKGDVFLAGLYSYADGERTYELLVVDASYPDDPLIGSLPLATYLSQVTIAANSAFVCLGDAGVLVVDISNPGEPIALATLEVPGRASEIAVADGRAYVAAGSGGLVVLDVVDLIVPEPE